MIDFTKDGKIKYDNLKSLHDSSDYSYQTTFIKELIDKCPPIQVYKFNKVKCIIKRYCLDGTCIVELTSGRNKGQLVFGIDIDVLLKSKLKEHPVYIIVNYEFKFKDSGKLAQILGKTINVYFNKQEVFTKIGSVKVSRNAPVVKNAQLVIDSKSHLLPDDVKFKFILL